MAIITAAYGMLTVPQAHRLKNSGLDYYNHNLDTSPEYYGEIITTRIYADRLETLDHVRAAGIHVCCGGIVGMGETRDDRVGIQSEGEELLPNGLSELVKPRAHHASGEFRPHAHTLLTRRIQLSSEVALRSCASTFTAA